MFDFNIGDEVYIFMISIANGLVIGLIYDFNRIIRVYSKAKGIRLMLEDFFFWLITAYIFFMFLIRNTDGVVRGFIVAGFLIGFFIYLKSISKYSFKLLNKIFKLILSLINEIIKLILYPFRKVKIFMKRKVLKWLRLPKIVFKDMKVYWKIISKKK